MKEQWPTFVHEAC